jgi:hypothetical protein
MKTRRDAICLSCRLQKNERQHIVFPYVTFEPFLRFVQQTRPGRLQCGLSAGMQSRGACRMSSFFAVFIHQR